MRVNMKTTKKEAIVRVDGNELKFPTYKEAFEYIEQLWHDKSPKQPNETLTVINDTACY